MPSWASTLASLGRHSLHAIAAQLSPLPGCSGIELLEAETFDLHCFETPTVGKLEGREGEGFRSLCYCSHRPPLRPINFILLARVWVLYLVFRNGCSLKEWVLRHSSSPTPFVVLVPPQGYKVPPRRRSWGALCTLCTSTDIRVVLGLRAEEPIL